MNLRILLLIAGLAGPLTAHADCDSSWAESQAATDKANASFRNENWEAAGTQAAEAHAAWRRTAEVCNGDNPRRALLNAQRAQGMKEVAAQKLVIQKRNESPCGFYWNMAEDSARAFWRRMSPEAADKAGDFWQLAAEKCTGADAENARISAKLMRTSIKSLAVARAAEAASAASAANAASAARAASTGAP